MEIKAMPAGENSFYNCLTPKNGYPFTLYYNELTYWIHYRKLPIYLQWKPFN